MACNKIIPREVRSVQTNKEEKICNLAIAYQAQQIKYELGK